MSSLVLTAMALILLGAFLVGYLLGSIPFGLLLTRLAGLGDVRSIGSGNIGATNVLRTGRRGLAAATLVCDMLKGTAAVLLLDGYARWNGLIGPEPGLVAGLGAVVGHVFPIWLKFKGGKGVATFVGVLIAVSWPAALVFGAIWIVVAAVTRYSSLSGLVATASTPAVVFLFADGRRALLFLALGLLIFIKHRNNIARLLAGTEPKIGTDSRESTAA